MTDTILLNLPTSPRLRGVATLVLGGLGSRLQLPYARVDDLQLAVLSVLSAATDETVTLEVAAEEQALRIGIGPLADGTCEDHGLRRVLERLVDGVEPAERDGREWLTLEVRRGQEAASG